MHSPPLGNFVGRRIGDWIHLLERDTQQFGIQVSDEQIQTVSLYKFKQFVKKKASKLMIQYLLGLQQKHSKSKYIDVEDLGMSPYLLDSRFNQVEREMLFQLRSRTISTKENFPNAYLNNDMLCQLCKLFPCTQFHILQCSSLVTSIIVDKSDQYHCGQKCETRRKRCVWNSWPATPLCQNLHEVLGPQRRNTGQYKETENVDQSVKLLTPNAPVIR